MVAVSGFLAVYIYIYIYGFSTLRIVVVLVSLSEQMSHICWNLRQTITLLVQVPPNVVDDPL